MGTQPPHRFAIYFRQARQTFVPSSFLLGLRGTRPTPAACAPSARLRSATAHRVSYASRIPRPRTGRLRDAPAHVFRRAHRDAERSAGRHGGAGVGGGGGGRRPPRAAAADPVRRGRRGAPGAPSQCEFASAPRSAPICLSRCVTHWKALRLRRSPETMTATGTWLSPDVSFARVLHWWLSRPFLLSCGCFL